MPISSLDIIPTALTAAGVEAHQSLKLDGVNLLPFLEGAEEGAPHERLLWRSGANSVARDGSWKLLQSEGGLTRLYNVDYDPGESQDFSNAHPQLIEELQGILKMGGRQGRTLRRNTEYQNSFQRGPHRVVCLGVWSVTSNVASLGWIFQKKVGNSRKEFLSADSTCAAR